MAFYAISDLHLSFGTDKPMNIFGPKWENYTERLRENWQEIVKPEDVVIIPGDISWALYLEEALHDFSFINSLNGTKLLLKGNHDYWWTTVSKMEKYFEENNFSTLKIINNTAFVYDDIAICGTRGWTIPPESSSGDDKKIFEREKIRLILSLEDAKSKKTKDIIVAMHYPPITEEDDDFFKIIKEYNVSHCVYGHLHGPSHSNAVEGQIDGINVKLVSCDYINFDPLFIKK